MSVSSHCHSSPPHGADSGGKGKALLCCGTKLLTDNHGDKTIQTTRGAARGEKKVRSSLFRCVSRLLNSTRMRLFSSYFGASSKPNFIKTENACSVLLTEKVPTAFYNEIPFIKLLTTCTLRSLYKIARCVSVHSIVSNHEAFLVMFSYSIEEKALHLKTNNNFLTFTSNFQIYPAYF